MRFSLLAPKPQVFHTIKMPTKKSLQIDIGVGGRFHADRMATAFVEGGHDVNLFTSYPKSRFPNLDKRSVHSLMVPEILYRLSKRFGYERVGEQLKMVGMGGWLASRARIRQKESDYCFIWSSFAKETFETLQRTHKVVVRDSTHIIHQCDILANEYGTLNIDYAPDILCVNRELAEYRLADSILVLSQFAKKTFLSRGIPEEKIRVGSLGVDTHLFRPRAEEKQALPLNVVYFGTISVRKGVHYLLEAMKKVSSRQVRLTLIGPVEENFKPILARYPDVKWLPPMPHSQLAPSVAQFDVYAFPSLEDGFPNTLVQAMASGLIPITTNECGPAELITDGEDGCLIPSRSSEAIAEKLMWLAASTERVIEMKRRVKSLGTTQTWGKYAAELNHWVGESHLPRIEVTQATPVSIPTAPLSQEASET